jgi:adenylate cyclase
MGGTRKIAAILVADIVGYSRLAGADEDRTLSRLRGLRGDLIDPAIDAYHGRIVKRTGDGILIEFRSVVDAVRCALEVQNGMVERNAGVPANRRIEFRVGIHLGDVVEENDGDLMGDGVNIAARLEGVAKPGMICLSEQAYWQVKGRLDLAVVDLGPTQLKNIADPVRVYSLQVGIPAVAKPAPPTEPATPAKPAAPNKSPASALLFAGIAALLVLIATGAWYFLAAKRPVAVATNAPAPLAASDALATAPRLSLVVLPFENLGGDKEQDYFADSITDDLTTDLSHLPESFVISRGTAFTYKGKAVDAKQIGRELGVRYVLEGSVRRVGENITVNAQLISTETGAHVWADRFDGKRSKLGELQVEFVARLANSLNAELIRAESLRALRERPDNPDAVDLAMRGWALANQTDSKERFNNAIALFERALSADSQNVQAVTGLALVLIWREGDGWSDDPTKDYARAEAIIDRALMLQPESSWLHDANANILANKHQWGPAIAELETAIAYDRNHANAHAVAGYFKQFVGRSEDGLSDLETALRLSPCDGGVPNYQSFVCTLQTNLGRWEEAIEWCNKAIAGNPELTDPLFGLAVANAWAGHDREAKDAVARIQIARPGFTVQKMERRDRWTDDPTFKAQWARFLIGLRKAGLPEY